MTGLQTTQLCALTLTSAEVTALGGAATADLVFLFKGNPDNYLDADIAAIVSVEKATTVQVKSNLGVINSVTSLLESGAFRRITVSGVVGTKRAKRELIVPSSKVSALTAAIEQGYEAGSPLTIGSGTNAMEAHSVAVGLKSVSR
jgi:hypothetical protein